MKVKLGKNTIENDPTRNNTVVADKKGIRRATVAIVTKHLIFLVDCIRKRAIAAGMRLLSER